MRFHFKEYKSWAWPLCALLFNLSRLIPFRDKKIWIMGNFEGKTYDDNTKYLYEYVNEKYHNKINAVWFTNSRETAEELMQRGMNSVIIGSWGSLRYLIRCGVVFYTHSLYDFGKLPLMGGAYVVTTWHGMGFKKIYGSEWTGCGKMIRKIKDFFFKWIYCDCACLTSEYTRKQFSRTLGIDETKIFLTGQPRNDVLMKTLNREAIMTPLGLPITKKLILYLPTWRNTFQRGKTLDVLIQELVDSESLNQVLLENDYLFLIKLHPSMPIPTNLRLNENFRILCYNDVSSNQELIGCGDILITDYSSCFVDFALMGKPIFFYTPDETEYLESCGGMEDDFYRISYKCKCTNPESLASLILEKPDIVARETNMIFDTTSTHLQSFSQNVIDVVCKEIGLNKNSCCQE